MQYTYSIFPIDKDRHSIDAEFVGDDSTDLVSEIKETIENNPDADHVEVLVHWTHQVPLEPTERVVIEAAIRSAVDEALPPSSYVSIGNTKREKIVEQAVRSIEFGLGAVR